MPRIRATADPSVRENKKEASSHLQGGETIVVREGNRKDVPSEMRNRFVRSFVCLFVCGVALRASTKLWRCGVRGGVYIYVRGLIRLFIVFGQFFDLEGGWGSLIKRKKNFWLFFYVRFWAFLCFRLPVVL